MIEIKDLFNELEKRNAHFNRKDYKGFLAYNLYTDGYNTKECYDYEELFMQHGFVALRREFIKECGKTVTYYIPTPGKQVRP